MRVTDDVGLAVEVADAPRRIVSLVPSLSEALWWFGAADKVIGVTRYCTRPVEGFRWAERVGGTKNPDVARIVDLAPDLVVANAEENRAEDLDAMREAGLPVFVTFPRTTTDSARVLQLLARVVGADEAGEQLRSSIDRAVAEAYVRRPEPSLRAFCAIWRAPYMGVGAGTYADDVLRVCGFENVLPAGPSRYPRVELDEVRAMEPDVVLLPDEPYPFTSEHRVEFEGWPARVVLFDGTLLSWYGPRTPEAIRGLTEMALALDREIRG